MSGFCLTGWYIFGGFRWDSLRSVRKAMDGYTDANVIPVPYYEKNRMGVFPKSITEGTYIQNMSPLQDMMSMIKKTGQI